MKHTTKFHPLNHLQTVSKNFVVGILTRIWWDNHNIVVHFTATAREFSLLQRFETISEAHPVS